jgi:anti-sigma regulatory factor (Ser/Thr protein kinase)
MSKDGMVVREGELVVFRGAYRPEDVWDMSRALSSFLLAKQRVILDFSRCTNAFPNSMIPLITFTARLRKQGYEIIAFLPKDPVLEARFHKTNWAHFLCPRLHRASDDYSERHLSVKQYHTSEEHYAILKQTLDVALGAVNAHRSSWSSLEWSLSEIMDNVLNHANSPVGGFVQLAIFPPSKKLAFCVADSGRGILESLREGIPALRSDRVAIGEAVRAGVTRNKDFGQGNGLSGSLALATKSGGWFRIVSGQAEFAWLSTEPEIREVTQEYSYYGTVVDVQLPYDKEIDISAILTESTKSPTYKPIAYSPTDFIETRYQSEDGNAHLLMMRSETSGFASRTAGTQMRTKATNLLASDLNMPLILDWDGIQVIASSFADEFLGKLFIGLGPMGFMNRIRFRNVDPTVQGIIDRAILQRTQQLNIRGE